MIPKLGCTILYYGPRQFSWNLYASLCSVSTKFVYSLSSYNILAYYWLCDLFYNNSLIYCDFFKNVSKIIFEVLNSSFYTVLECNLWSMWNFKLTHKIQNSTKFFFLHFLNIGCGGYIFWILSFNCLDAEESKLVKYFKLSICIMIINFQHCSLINHVDKYL